MLEKEKVVKLLDALGVTGATSDPLLDFILQSVTQTIKNETNQSTIPEGLGSVAVNMAAGQYLTFKKGAGQLENFDLEAAEKQITEGDTSVTFAIGEGSLTPEQRLDRLLDFLMYSGVSQFTAFRRLKW